MLYRKATNRELKTAPGIKAYGWVFSWYHWALPVWGLWIIQRPPRWVCLEDMFDWLEPGDCYWVNGGLMTFDGYGEKIQGMEQFIQEKRDIFESYHGI